jgi:hypothetical protein
MNEAGRCPRCKLIIEATLRSRQRETQALIDEVEAFLAGDEGEAGRN